MARDRPQTKRSNRRQMVGGVKCFGDLTTRNNIFTLDVTFPSPPNRVQGYGHNLGLVGGVNRVRYACPTIKVSEHILTRTAVTLH